MNKLLQFSMVGASIDKVADIGCVAEDDADTYNSVVLINIVLHVTEMSVMLSSM